MILASSLPSNCQPEEARLYPCSLNCIPNFDDITFYLVEIITGEVCDKRTYKNECIHLSYHSGVSFIGNLFSIMSIQNQIIHILHIKDDGHFVDVQDIGWLNYDDDQLVLAQYRNFDAQFQINKRTMVNPILYKNATSEIMELDEEKLELPSLDSALSAYSFSSPMDNKVPSSSFIGSRQNSMQGISELLSTPPTEKDVAPISGIKQRLLTYLFKKAYDIDDGGLALRHFYQIFGQLSSLVMWKIQFIDESRFLIKFGNVDCVTGHHNDGASHTAFFVIYNFLTTEVISVFDNASEEFLTEYETLCDVLQQVAFNEPFSFNSAYSNNIYARENFRKYLYSIRHARNGGPFQAVKRVLASLPYGPQTCSESPYFDHALFSYDDKTISAFDRPRPCYENVAKFYSRETKELKFKIVFGLPDRSSNRIK
ncbi:24222_t:CDS:2 [Cetraspora pellucida]|uniref:24222_t:CDS:1 n=1 Tax=Cetraspora pellucida TaxID=1433469 RepID=A0A9N8ZUC9_9GLOM|nr:24222_t:CDS:2 [Cetraspora pellucida]